MSPQLPAVSGKQVIRALEKEGWYLKRVRGSHHALRHPTIPDTVVVPVHGNRSLPRGTLLSILRVAGLSREEFVPLLR